MTTNRHAIKLVPTPCPACGQAASHPYRLPVEGQREEITARRDCPHCRAPFYALLACNQGLVWVRSTDPDLPAEARERVLGHLARNLITRLHDQGSRP